MTVKFDYNAELETNRQYARELAGTHVSGWKVCIVEVRNSGKIKPRRLNLLFLPLEKAIAGFTKQCDDGTRLTVVEIY